MLWWELGFMLGSALLAVVLMFLAIVIFWRPLFDRFMDRIVRRLFTDPYVENLLEGFNAMRRHGFQHDRKPIAFCQCPGPVETHRHPPPFSPF